VDAVWCVENLFGEGQLAELWTFFPDPWHKKRHHKRRLVNPDFAHLAATRLAPGGLWRLATDWGDYAEQAIEVLAAEPLLEGGAVDRWADRPLTRFERRGLKEGREITDLAFRRV
jgi:tRNA (guanine-N7-)-methyltransferase